MSHCSLTLPRRRKEGLRIRCRRDLNVRMSKARNEMQTPNAATNRMPVVMDEAKDTRLSKPTQGLSCVPMIAARVSIDSGVQPN
jgi:hypothetical protein